MKVAFNFYFKSSVLSDQKGFGLYEILMALGVLTLIGIGILIHFSSHGFGKLFQPEQCENVVAKLLTSVKAFDNSSPIRTRILGPAETTSPTVTTVGGIFCPEPGYPGCDTQPVLSYTSSGGDIGSYRNSLGLNIRDTTTWAINIWNRNLPMETRIVFGTEDVPLASLNRYLPNLPTLSDSVRRITMTIVPRTISGVEIPVEDGPLLASLKNGIKLVINFRVNLTAEGRDNECSGAVEVGYDRPSHGPPSSIQGPIQIYNGANMEVTSARRCTCQQPWNPNLDCSSEMLRVYTHAFDIPPGGLALCTPSGSGFRGGSTRKLCTEFSDSVARANGNDVPTMGQDIFGDLKFESAFQFTSAAGNSPHQISVEIVDVNGQVSPKSSTIQFLVRQPTCPDPATYCPNAPRPGDGCNANTTCPQGTLDPPCPEAACGTSPTTITCGKVCTYPACATPAGVLPNGGATKANSGMTKTLGQSGAVEGAGNVTTSATVTNEASAKVATPVNEGSNLSPPENITPSVSPPPPKTVTFPPPGGCVCDPNRPCGSISDTCGAATCPTQTASPPCTAAAADQSCSDSFCGCAACVSTNNPTCQVSSSSTSSICTAWVDCNQWCKRTGTDCGNIQVFACR